MSIDLLIFWLLISILGLIGSYGVFIDRSIDPPHKDFRRFNAILSCIYLVSVLSLVIWAVTIIQEVMT